MPQRKKTGPSPGLGRWEKLDTIGDAKRFVRWLILSLRDGRLDHRDVAAFVQAGNLLTRLLESNDIEQRLQRLEERLKHENTYPATDED